MNSILSCTSDMAIGTSSCSKTLASGRQRAPPSTTTTQVWAFPRSAPSSLLNHISSHLLASQRNNNNISCLIPGTVVAFLMKISMQTTTVCKKEHRARCCYQTIIEEVSRTKRYYYNNSIRPFHRRISYTLRCPNSSKCSKM
jgi:hypothetical protein